MKLFKLLIFAFLLTNAVHASAATIFFESQKEIPKQGELLVQVKIDTERISVNTISGSINVPASFEVQKIYDGDSSIVVWIEQPKFDSNTHLINFSGITPGGFSGVQKLFSVTLKPSKQGTFTLRAENIEVYKNDGKGTIVVSKVKPFTFSITNKTSNTVINMEDKNSPEDFTPVISKDIGIYDGNYFVSFATTDKGVGIDHYEVAERWIFSPNKDAWKISESPLVLEGLSNAKIIYIKAVDKLGNERIESVWGPYRIKVLSVLGLIIIFGYFFLASKKRKR